MELGQALENLKNTQTQLVEKEKLAALGKLTAGIAHEMNSPLGVVSSSADSFQRYLEKIIAAIENSKTLDEIRSDRSFQRSVEAIRENSHVIADASDRISKIVKSLKTFTDFEEGTFQNADIHESIKNALALLQHQLGDGVKVRTAYSDVPRIWCNPTELTQVFITLLTNAAQAIETKGEISIESAREGDCVRVSVADTGRGIAKDKIGSLFDFVFTTKGSRVGVGMGLPSAHNIVHRLGGQISVSSETNRGTEFKIRLPLHPATPPANG